MPVFLRTLRRQPVLQLHIRPRGKAALPAWEGLHRKEGENEKQETEFRVYLKTGNMTNSEGFFAC